MTMNKQENVAFELERTTRELIDIAGWVDEQQNLRVSLKTTKAKEVCAKVTELLARTSDFIGLVPHCRQYRESFTMNYKALFGESASQQNQYRIDVLEACIEEYKSIYVNGRKFDFSDDVLTSSKNLLYIWTNILLLLKSDFEANDLCAVLEPHLVKFDVSWTLFEKSYINQLILIEEESRDVIKNLCRLDHSLRALEKCKDRTKTQEYRILRRQLMKEVNELNSVANSRGKGRSDLVEQILYDSEEFVNRHRAQKDDTGYFIAEDAIDSYLKLRKYLRDVSDCLERVDPHLCNNNALVTCLAHWEETWELALQFLQNPKLLNTVQDLCRSVFVLSGSACFTGSDISDSVLERTSSHHTLLCNDGSDSNRTSTSFKSPILRESSGDREIREADMESEKRESVNNALMPELLEKVLDNDCDVFLSLPRILILRMLQLRRTNNTRGSGASDLLSSISSFVSDMVSRNYIVDSDDLPFILPDGVELIRVKRFSTICEVFDNLICYMENASGISSRSANDILVKGIVGSSESEYLSSLPDFHFLKLEIENWSMELQRHSPGDWNTFMKVVTTSIIEIDELEAGSKIRAQFASNGYFGSSRKQSTRKNTPMRV